MSYYGSQYPGMSDTAPESQSTNNPGYNQVNQPVGFPRESYTYTPNGLGGVNYFQGGNAISNTDYGRATGEDYGSIEKSIADAYARTQVGDSTLKTGRAPSLDLSLGSKSSSPSYSQEDVAYIDDLISNYNRQLGRTTSGLDTGLRQLDSTFNKEQSRQNDLRGRALEDFDTRSSDTEMAKNRAIGSVDTNARTLADSLRRKLGMAGGTDSSAFKYAAPEAVARQASGERTDVLSNYGQNFRDLDTSKKRATTDFENLLADLAEQRKSKETSLRSGVMEQQNQISEALANAAREKASIMGGGYTAARNASRGYTNDIASRETAIDQLLNQGITPYSVKDVQVNAPSLRDYTVDRQAINANQGSASTYSPYEQLLKRRNEEAVV